jgi:hypothetical protein
MSGRAATILVYRLLSWARRIIRSVALMSDRAFLASTAAEGVRRTASPVIRFQS